MSHIRYVIVHHHIRSMRRVGRIVHRGWSCPLAESTFRLNGSATIKNMVLSLNISAEAEARLKAKAVAAGVDVETYAARYIELLALPPKSLKDISGPIAEDFARSGMSEDELSDFLETEKHTMRAERTADRPASQIRPVRV